MNISFNTDASWHCKYFFVSSKVVWSSGIKGVEEEFQDNSDGSCDDQRGWKEEQTKFHYAQLFIFWHYSLVIGLNSYLNETFREVKREKSVVFFDGTATTSSETWQQAPAGSSFIVRGESQKSKRLGIIGLMIIFQARHMQPIKAAFR